MNKLMEITAQALVETVIAHPHIDCGDLCDAILRCLRGCGCTHADLARFPMVVSQELRAKGLLRATLRTPSGKSGQHRRDIAQALKRATHASIELAEDSVPSLLGGAVLRVGDDVLDRSLRGALRRLAQELTPSSPQP